MQMNQRKQCLPCNGSGWKKYELLINELSIKNLIIYLNIKGVRHVKATEQMFASFARAVVVSSGLFNLELSSKRTVMITLKKLNKYPTSCYVDAHLKISILSKV